MCQPTHADAFFQFFEKELFLAAGSPKSCKQYEV